ncbi:hypothetical protein, partial [Acrocarpospora macrocephala]
MTRKGWRIAAAAIAVAAVSGLVVLVIRALDVRDGVNLADLAAVILAAATVVAGVVVWARRPAPGGVAGRTAGQAADPFEGVAAPSRPASPPGGLTLTGSTVGRDSYQFGSARDVSITAQVADRAPLPPAAATDAPPGLAGLPRPPAAVFLGREQALARLEGALTTATAMAGNAVITQAAVHGLGGIGKSELALQYATRHRRDYRLVWWAEADTPANIQTSLAGLARAICAGPHSIAAGQASVEEGAAWAMSWLVTHTGWLLVLDNVEQAADIIPYLGRLSGGQVLITTRRSIGWRELGSTPIDLNVLAPGAAAALLADLVSGSPTAPASMPDEHRRPGDEQAGELAGLAAELGYLPLALTQAGTFIARTPGMTVPDYRRSLRETPAQAYAAVAAGTDGERVIAQVWTLTRARVAKLDPLTPRLLALLACYAPDHLPLTVLHHLPGVSRLQIGQALGVLASYSMITLTSASTANSSAEAAGSSAGSAGETVSVHRLVQAVTLAGLTPGQQADVKGQAADLLAAALPDNPKVIGSWAEYGRLLPHARAALSSDSAAMGQVLDYLAASGDYATAKTLQHLRRQALDDTQGAEHPDTLTARADLASYTGQAGDAVAARDQYAALLPIRERVS